MRCSPPRPEIEDLTMFEGMKRRSARRRSIALGAAIGDIDLAGHLIDDTDGLRSALATGDDLSIGLALEGVLARARNLSELHRDLHRLRKRHAAAVA
jgi:hypothetical protein